LKIVLYFFCITIRLKNTVLICRFKLLHKTAQCDDTIGRDNCTGLLRAKGPRNDVKLRVRHCEPAAKQLGRYRATEFILNQGGLLSKKLNIKNHIYLIYNLLGSLPFTVGLNNGIIFQF